MAVEPEQMLAQHLVSADAGIEYGKAERPLGASNSDTANTGVARTMTKQTTYIDQAIQRQTKPGHAERGPFRPPRDRLPPVQGCMSDRAMCRVDVP